MDFDAICARALACGAVCEAEIDKLTDAIASGLSEDDAAAKLLGLLQAESDVAKLEQSSPLLTGGMSQTGEDSFDNYRMRAAPHRDDIVVIFGLLRRPELNNRFAWVRADVAEDGRQAVQVYVNGAYGAPMRIKVHSDL